MAFVGYPVSSEQQLFETGLKSSWIPISAGLAEDRSRGYIYKLITNYRGVRIEGYVQCIPTNDIKVGHGNNWTLLWICKELEECEVDVLKFLLDFHRNLSFRIHQSASPRAKKSNLSDDRYDKKSVRSGSTSRQSDRWHFKT